VPTTSELYPGRNVIVGELLDAWRTRSRYAREAGVGWGVRATIAADLRECERTRIESLRRVWRGLRLAGRLS
jgi:hypothetical protein